MTYCLEKTHVSVIGFVGILAMALLQWQMKGLRRLYLRKFNAGIGSDLEGGGLAPVRIIAHAPRLLEASYAEWIFPWFESSQYQERTTTHLTLALGESLFHLRRFQCRYRRS